MLKCAQCPVLFLTEKEKIIVRSGIFKKVNKKIMTTQYLKTAIVHNLYHLMQKKNSQKRKPWLNID